MTSGGALLGVVDADILPKLRERGHRRTHRSGEILMRQGDPSPAMFLIVEGRVRVERIVPALAAPLHIADLGPGEVVGEIGVVDVAPRSATVKAISDVVLIELSRQATFEALLEVPRLPQVLRRVIEKRLAENRLREAHLTESKLLEERLARYVRRERIPA